MRSCISVTKLAYYDENSFDLTINKMLIELRK